MAGGKETPRQKMVGMMYLVLTALLALQVSNAVLDKFVFIDESLKYSVSLSKSANEKVYEGMKALVEKEGNRAKDVEVLKSAEDARSKTAALLNEIDKIRQELITYTGGLEEDGSYKGAKEYDPVMAFMIGPEGSRSGKAYGLQKKINDFVVEMAKKDSSLRDLKPIALDGKEMPMYQKKNEYNESQRQKDFAQVNFGETPLVASLAVLSQFQSEVVRVESKVLEKLAAKVGNVVIKFDKIIARATAESKVVAAGTKYKAKMFIAASSSQVSPRMSSSAGPVKVENGEGTIEFTASGGGYDANGNVKKEWKGQITIPTAYGDTTFTLTEEYIVAKPVIQVQSANVSALYLNCGNELSIQVPALGANYDPSFAATGAEVIKSGAKGVITVVPNAASVTLRVSSGGNLIGEEKFKVRLLPKPDIEIRSGAKKIDEKLGGAMPRSLKAVALAEASIRDAIPKDARYKVTDWDVTLARGRRAVGNIKVSGDEANLTSLAANAKEGDRLVIEVKGVKRLNFKGQTEDVKVGTVIIQYPITQ